MEKQNHTCKSLLNIFGSSDAFEIVIVLNGVPPDRDCRDRLQKCKFGEGLAFTSSFVVFLAGRYVYYLGAIGLMVVGSSLPLSVLSA